MAKLTLTDLANLENQTTAVGVINNNSAAIEVAFENTLSRDGTTPNTMSANLDMNSNQILNLPSPASLDSPVRLRDTIEEAVAITVPPVGTSGAVVPLLNANNTWSGVQSYDPNKLALKGSTSGSTVVNASAVASGTLTLPATTDTVVVRNTTETLTNKTLTSPTINGATVGTSTINTSTINSPTITSPTITTSTVTGKMTMTEVDASIEMGTQGTSNSPYIDFHSSSTANDYDVRLRASGSSGSSGNGTLTVSAATQTNSGKIQSTSNSAGIGYGTGSGSTVTQITSKSTAVTINAINGAITLHNQSLGSGVAARFTVNNSVIEANDNVVLAIVSGAATAASYQMTVEAIAGGSFAIGIKNTAGGALAEAFVIKFTVLKGSNS